MFLRTILLGWGIDNMLSCLRKGPFLLEILLLSILLIPDRKPVSEGGALRDPWLGGGSQKLGGFKVQFPVPFSFPAGGCGE